MIWKNKRPLYCDQDQAAHKKMLSRHFRCSNTELLIFEKLCAMWSEEVYYRIFFHHVSSFLYGVEKVLLIFLRKLEHAGFAAIRTVYDERGKHIPEKIILSDRHSPFIAQSIVEEQYCRVNHNPKRPYVTEDMLHIPDHIKQQHIKSVSLADLYAMREGRFSIEAKMYRITLSEVPIIFCFSAFADFYSATEKKVRSYLQSAHLISDLQRTHLAFVDGDTVRHAVETLQYDKLGILIGYMLQNYLRITGVYPPVERHLLQATTILHYVNEVRSEVSVQLQMKNKRITRDFKKIYDTVHNAAQWVVSKEEYHGMIRAHQYSWGDSFEENVITLCTNSPEHPLLITSQLVLHKEHMEDYFSKNYTEIQENIYHLLIEDMHKHIKIGDLSININYTNISRLEEYLLHIVESADSILHYILKYPHHYSTDIVSMQYYIMLAFNIDLNELFFHACSRLSFFRRILYKLSNEYADLKSHFHFLARVVENAKEKEYGEMATLELSSNESDWRRAFQALFRSHEHTSA